MNCRSKTNFRYGVIPVPIYTKPYKCGGTCIFCPSAEGIPKSYLPNQDTLTAKKFSYDPIKQLNWRIKLLPTSLIQTDYPFEIIILGGSFSSLPMEYRKSFIANLYSALNSKNSEDPIIHRCKKSFKGRCSVLTIESRPDQITNKECLFLRELGVTKVELGVQHTSNRILDMVYRGHQQEHTIEATSLLKKHGFKVGYHVMLGLPGASIDDDLYMVSKTLWRSQFSPDYLKIYPCTLLKDEKLQPRLHDIYKSKLWIPPSEEYCQICMECLSKALPDHVRVSRIQRQFSNNEILAGPERGLRSRLLAKINDLRAREAGSRLTLNSNLHLSGLFISLKEKEHDNFIEVTQKHNDILLAIARITFISRESIILRELKVFGEANSIGMKGQIQGNGLGTTLLFAIEHHYRKKKIKNIFINSSVGATSFFVMNGYYKATDTLLTKDISQLSFNNTFRLPHSPFTIFEKSSSNMLLPDYFLVQQRASEL